MATMLICSGWDIHTIRLRGDPIVAAPAQVSVIQGAVKGGTRDQGYSRALNAG
jgi:hypothetical protein